MLGDGGLIFLSGSAIDDRRQPVREIITIHTSLTV